MTSRSTIVVLLSLGLLLLCGADVASAQTQQCSIQGTYPNPLDQSGHPIGSLLQVSFSSKVGVVLDDIPKAMRDTVANWYLARPPEFWRQRAIKQIELAQYRLNFRNYYVAGQGALPIPYSDLWNIHIIATPHRAI